MMGVDQVELTSSDWVSILIYGSFAAYVATAIPSLFRGRFLVGLAALAFWAVTLFAILAGYAYRTELATVADRVMGVLIPGTAVETGPHEVTVFRRPDGQFMLTVGVGSAHLSFVLDTGASSVVLRAEDAAKLKIAMKRLVFDVEVSTANGHTLAAETTLPSVSIGGIAEADVPALVARPGALHENLLGMSFLNRLESFTVTKDRLVMEGVGTTR